MNGNEVSTEARDDSAPDTEVVELTLEQLAAVGGGGGGAAAPDGAIGQGTL